MQLKSNLIDYYNLFDKYRLLSYTLFIIGGVLLITYILNLNTNLYFGIVNCLQALVLFAISLNRQLSIKTILPVALSFIVMLIAEFLLLGIPKPLIQGLNDDLLTNRIIGILKVINTLSPSIYCIIKITIVGLLIYAYLKKQAVFKSINSLEKLKF